MCVCVCVCVFDTNCVRYTFFLYNVIFVNCDVCECVHVLYKYNIILKNSIIMKYKEFVTCVCIVFFRGNVFVLL